MQLGSNCGCYGTQKFLKTNKSAKVVPSLAPSTLIGTSSNFQVSRTSINVERVRILARLDRSFQSNLSLSDKSNSFIYNEEILPQAQRHL